MGVRYYCRLFVVITPPFAISSWRPAQQRLMGPTGIPGSKVIKENLGLPE